MRAEYQAPTDSRDELGNSALHGRVIVVTRPAEQSRPLVEMLHKQGARAISIPVVSIGPPPDEHALSTVLDGVGSFDWIVFTSVNAVNAVASRIANETREGKRAKIAAVGLATTRAISAAGLQVDYSTERDGHHLAANIPGVDGATVLLPRSSIGLRAVADELTRRGARVTEIAAYATQCETTAAASIASCFATPVDAVLFTSPSTVTCFLASVAEAGLDVAALRAAGTRWVCIGTTTANALGQYNLHADETAESPSDAALVKATERLFQR